MDIDSQSIQNAEKVIDSIPIEVFSKAAIQEGFPENKDDAKKKLRENYSKSSLGFLNALGIKTVTVETGCSVCNIALEFVEVDTGTGQWICEDCGRVNDE